MKRHNLNKKNIALIGSGYWGKVHLKYLKNSKIFNLKKIFYRNNKNNIDRNQSLKKKLTNDLESILNDKKIEYIDIVTPIDTHSDLVDKFLIYKKKILVEKPLLMSDAQEKIFNKNKKKITVAYPYLFSSTLKFAKKIIDSKKIGNILFLELNFQQLGRFSKDNVQKLLGPHCLSILSIFFNIKNIKFKNIVLIKKKSKTETCTINCTFKNKIVSRINLSLNYASYIRKKEVNIFCDKGFIRCDLNNQKSYLEAYKIKRNKIKKYHFEKIDLKSIYQKKFDEANNVKKLIDSFILYQANNFELTKKINSFLKNEK